MDDQQHRGAQDASLEDYFSPNAGPIRDTENDPLFTPLTDDGSAAVPLSTPLGFGSLQSPGSGRLPQVEAGGEAAPSRDDDAEDDPVTVNISTAFHLGSNDDPAPTDLVLRSNDDVLFYVHAHRLLSASHNAFNHLLADSDSAAHDPQALSHWQALSPVLGAENPHRVVSTPATASAVLNVVLHTAYGLSCAAYRPTLAVLASALNALPTYGFPPAPHLAPTGLLYPLVLALAPLHPIDVYAIAAELGAHALAVACSPHLISFDLATLSDDLAARIGPLYIKKLFFLHLGRIDALKRLLLPAPYPHPETRTCGFEEQRKVMRAWAMATASLAWEARPDISDRMIEATLAPLGDGMHCGVCRDGLTNKVRDLVVQWNCVKRTI